MDALHLAEEHHHYEPRTGRPAHYHLACVACGDVQEVTGGGLARLREALRRDRGFRLTAAELEVQGRCRCCAPAG